MKRIVIAGAFPLVLALAGCSQTTGDATTTASVSGNPSRQMAAKQTPTTSKRDACEKAMRSQTNAAMLGSALGMVGGLGGFGGQGGAIAGHVASTAGSMVAQSQSANARASVMQECYS